MEPLRIRRLTQVTTLSFEHNEANVALLLRLLADYCEASGGTLLGVSYTNEMEDAGYTERITAHVECPWSR